MAPCTQRATASRGNTTASRTVTFAAVQEQACLQIGSVTVKAHLIVGIVVMTCMMSGCQTTQTVSVHDAGALTQSPQIGIESIAGSWSGTWKGLTGRSTLVVTAPSVDDIEVKYCYSAWCAGGCSKGKGSCGWYANKLKDIRFEDEALKFRTFGGSEFVWTRVGSGLAGLYRGKYEARFRRRR